MGIKTEYNPDLALRNYKEFELGNRKKEECIPPELCVDKIYNFLKKGQRVFWLEGEILLLKTKGNEILSNPLASIVIIETTHLLINKELFTMGKYQVKEIFNPEDGRIHFNGFSKVEY